MDGVQKEEELDSRPDRFYQLVQVQLSLQVIICQIYKASVTKLFTIFFWNSIARPTDPSIQSSIHHPTIKQVTSEVQTERPLVANRV